MSGLENGFENWRQNLNTELKRRCAIDLTDVGLSETEQKKLFATQSVRPASVVVDHFIDKYDLQDITMGW